MMIHQYDLRAIDFRPWARRVLGCNNLEDLHKLPDAKIFSTYVDRLRYYVSRLERESNEISALYQDFVQTVLAPLFGGVERFQQPHPSFRFHLVGAGTSSAFHRDGEPKYNVTPGSLNAWVPLTQVSKSNSLYIETSLGSGRFRPVAMRPGEVLIFDAFHLAHGSIPNSTNATRVSFDLRFVPGNQQCIAASQLYSAKGSLRGIPIDRNNMVIEDDENTRILHRNLSTSGLGQLDIELGGSRKDP